jgi:hypothetical protein
MKRGSSNLDYAAAVTAAELLQSGASLERKRRICCRDHAAQSEPGEERHQFSSTALRAICVIHCSVGCLVMPAMVTRRVSRCRKNRT